MFQMKVIDLNDIFYVMYQFIVRWSNFKKSLQIL